MHLHFLQQEYFGSTVLDYIKFLVILALALLLKRYISRIFTNIFFRVFKKFSKAYFGQQFKDLVLGPIEGIIVTILFYIAFAQINGTLEKMVLFSRSRSQKQGGDLHVTANDVVDHLFFFFLLFYIISLIVRAIEFIFLVLVERAKEKEDRERQQILPLLKDVLKVIVWAFGILSLLGAVFHVNVAALIASLGVGGIAIAFAAKDSLENLLASFMVMIDKPFTIGDWIKIGDVEGTIEKIGFRSTRVRSFDRSVISIPNRKLIDSNLENFSDRGMRRVMFKVGAIYGLSEQNLKATVSGLISTISSVENTVGEPIVRLDEFADSSVNFLIIYFVSVSPEVDFLEVKEAVNYGIYKVMYQHAQGFAYPTQVEIKKEDLNEVV